MRQRTSGPYGCMELASLIAAHWTNTDSSAAFKARSRSRENVAMPHCRGGQVATKATDRLRSSTRFACLVMCRQRSRLGAQPVEDVSDLRGHESHAGVCRAVVQTQFARGAVEHRSTWKNDIGNITCHLIRGVRTYHPLVTASQDPPRVIQIEQSQANAIERARRRVTHTVVDNQPALCRLDRLGRQTNLARVPPGAVTCLEQHGVIAPVV